MCVEPPATAAAAAATAGGGCPRHRPRSVDERSWGGGACHRWRLTRPRRPTGRGESARRAGRPSLWGTRPTCSRGPPPPPPLAPGPAWVPTTPRDAAHGLAAPRGHRRPLGGGNGGLGSRVASRWRPVRGGFLPSHLRRGSTEPSGGRTLPSPPAHPLPPPLGQAGSIMGWPMAHSVCCRVAADGPRRHPTRLPLVCAGDAAKLVAGGLCGGGG